MALIGCCSPFILERVAEPGEAAAPHPASPVGFATTRWTLVAAAGKGATPEARKALADLCGLYWYPLYAFVRRRGYNADDALDLTQGFFTRLIEKNDLAAADPARGRFRGWLLASVKHYLANEWDKATARKRGGGVKVFSFDAGEAEDRYRREPADALTPEKIFERRWAMMVLEQTLSALEQESRQAGRGDLFEALRPSLTGAGDTEAYRAVADRVGMSEGAVKVAAHRLRRRYRELLRQAIAETVRTPQEVDEEIKELFAALAGDDKVKG